MPYEVEAQINLTVKGGPSAKAKIKLRGITDANNKIITFENDTTHPEKLCTVKVMKKDEKGDEHEHVRYVICKKFKLAGPVSIAFLAIRAPRYRFKHCPTGETSGIGFFLLDTDLAQGQMSVPMSENANADDGCITSGVTWVDDDYIVLNPCASSGEKKDKWMALFVDPNMFDCTKNPTEKFEITVIYGLVGDEVLGAAPESCCGQVPEPATQSRSIRTNGRMAITS